MTLEQIKQERQAFEDFMRSQNNGDRLELDADGSYADISIDYAWSGWQARAKQPEWVSVDERPPENSQPVIAAVQQPCIARYCQRRTMYRLIPVMLLLAADKITRRKLNLRRFL